MSTSSFLNEQVPYVLIVRVRKRSAAFHSAEFFKECHVIPLNLDIHMNPLRNDEAYEEAAATYQIFMIHWLNAALEDGGISDATQRRKIIQTFGFDFSIWTDQYWFMTQSENIVYPCISFSSNGPVAECEDLGDVLLPTGYFSFKEYLNSGLDYYFDEIKEDISQIESGPPI